MLDEMITNEGLPVHCRWFIYTERTWNLRTWGKLATLLNICKYFGKIQAVPSTQGGRFTIGKSHTAGVVDEAP